MVTKYEVRGDPAYAAQAIEVKALIELPGLDNLVGVNAFGYTALVSRDVKVGDTLVVFPAECQLGAQFAASRNLHRHPALNDDPTQVGYLEDNRRVRAIRLRGQVSNALALAWDVPVGTVFDTVDGVQISSKYELPVKGSAFTAPSTAKTRHAVLPEHPDTSQWYRLADSIPDDTWLTVTQKLDGTSVRIANTKVMRNLSWLERLAKKFGITVAETEYAHIYGSRKVIKDPEVVTPGFYDTDIYSLVGKDITLPKGVMLFGEIIGYTPTGQAIQPGYTYDLRSGEMSLYVYRVAVLGSDGSVYDLSRGGVEQFCAALGLKVVPLLWQGFKRDFIVEDFLDKRFCTTYAQAVPTSNNNPDEGVVIQVQGIVPTNFKAKGAGYYALRTKALDKNEGGLEA